MNDGLMMMMSSTKTRYPLLLTYVNIGSTFALRRRGCARRRAASAASRPTIVFRLVFKAHRLVYFKAHRLV